jgi:hypothetical protein
MLVIAGRVLTHLPGTFRPQIYEDSYNAQARVCHRRKTVKSLTYSPSYRDCARRIIRCRLKSAPVCSENRADAFARMLFNSEGLSVTSTRRPSMSRETFVSTGALSFEDSVFIRCSSLQWRADLWPVWPVGCKGRVVGNMLRFAELELNVFRHPFLFIVQIGIHLTFQCEEMRP